VSEWVGVEGNEVKWRASIPVRHPFMVRVTSCSANAEGMLYVEANCCTSSAKGVSDLKASQIDRAEGFRM
jgi:hypothetical protein